MSLENSEIVEDRASVNSQIQCQADHILIIKDIGGLDAEGGAQIGAGIFHGTCRLTVEDPQTAPLISSITLGSTLESRYHYVEIGAFEGSSAHTKTLSSSLIPN